VAAQLVGLAADDDDDDDDDEEEEGAELELLLDAADGPLYLGRRSRKRLHVGWRWRWWRWLE
jgi:hypothetical protein